MKRAAISAFIAAVFTFVAFITIPPMERVRAQVPMHFGATRAPSITVDRNDSLFLTMSVATKDGSTQTPGSQTFFTLSRDGGATWNNLPLTKNLSRSKGEAFGPAIAIFKPGKGKSYIVYHDNSGGTTQSYIIDSKKGAKFKKPRNITPGAGGAFSPRVDVDSTGAVNVVWGDTTDGGKRVMFLRSTDGSATFSQPRDISRSPAQAFEPEIAIDSNDSINVVWEDSAPGNNVVMFARSNDGGETFSDPLQVSTGTGFATDVHIAIDKSNRLHVVWIEENGNDAQAFYARSIDGGQTFSAPIALNDNPSANAHKPFVTTFNDTVYVAYQTEGGSRRQVFLVKSEDAGASFSGAEQVSRADNSKGRGHSPSMVVDSRGRLHIVWIDSSLVGNDEGVMFYSNTRNGRDFTAQQVIIAALP